MKITDAIEFFHDCYQCDNSRSVIWDIFKPSIKHRVFLKEQEQLITGELSYVAIDKVKGEKVHKDSYLYRKEKDTFYCSLFIIGKVEINKKEESVCAPLIFYPAAIKNDETTGMFTLSINTNEFQVNQFILDKIQNTDESLSSQISKILARKPVSKQEFIEIGRLLKECISNLDTKYFDYFPKLYSEDDLKSVQKSTIERSLQGLHLVSCSAFILVDKPKESKGVLNELKEMAGDETFSKPIEILLGNSKLKTMVPGVKKINNVPAVLSEAQARILRSGALKDISLVIGPPGTGKSFTIACLAIDHFSRGESVLISSQKNHAVDVVAEKIESLMGEKKLVVRGGKKQYLKDLKSWISSLLNGQGLQYEQECQDNVAAAWGKLKRIQKRMDKSTHYFKREMRVERDFESLVRNPSTISKKLLIPIRKIRKKFVVSLAKVVDEFMMLLHQKNELVREWHTAYRKYNEHEILKNHRKELISFSKAIRARTGHKQEDYFNQLDFALLLKTFPVWMVKLSSVSKILPLKKELFDVAIIDEATQCDIASALPLIQRAKRLIIVGDPKQLSHISFLSRDDQKKYMNNYDISGSNCDKFDYRENNLLEFVSDQLTSQTAVTFLNEHFRSLPRLIDFSNKHFYNNDLLLMTQKVIPNQKESLNLFPIQGCRTQAGVNNEEVKALIRQVKALVDSQKNAPIGACYSIGILSPFRSQVDSIGKAVTSGFSLKELERHDLLIGTAHSFQGEERDIMFMSFALDDDSHRAAFRFLEKEDVFNVSITRARLEQNIFVSFDHRKLDHNSLLYFYVESVQNGFKEVAIGGARSTTDTFASEVIKALEVRGYECLVNYPLAGQIIDMVVTKNDQAIGIDLIGHPGCFSDHYSLSRYKILNRLGLKIVPLSYLEWIMDRNICIYEIMTAK